MPKGFSFSAVARERRAKAIHAELQRLRLQNQVRRFEFVPRPGRQVSSIALGFMLAGSLGSSWLSVAMAIEVMSAESYNLNFMSSGQDIISANETCPVLPVLSHEDCRIFGSAPQFFAPCRRETYSVVTDRDSDNGIKSSDIDKARFAKAGVSPFVDSLSQLPANQLYSALKHFDETIAADPMRPYTLAEFIVFQCLDSDRLSRLDIGRQRIILKYVAENLGEGDLEYSFFAQFPAWSYVLTSLVAHEQWGLLDEVLSTLSSKLDLTERNPRGSTPLCLAAAMNSERATRRLASFMSDDQKRLTDYVGMTAAHYAAFWGMSSDLLEMLNVDPELKDAHGNTVGDYQLMSADDKHDMAIEILDANSIDYRRDSRAVRNSIALRNADIYALPSPVVKYFGLISPRMESPALQEGASTLLNCQENFDRIQSILASVNFKNLHFIKKLRDIEGGKIWKKPYEAIQFIEQRLREIIELSKMSSLSSVSVLTHFEEKMEAAQCSTVRSHQLGM